MSGGAGPGEISLEAIEGARPAVARIAVRTPIFVSRFLSELTGSRVVLKAENLQKTGSFKIRGASAKLAALGPTPRPESSWPRPATTPRPPRSRHGPRRAVRGLHASRGLGIEGRGDDRLRGLGASRGESLDDCVVLAEERARKTGLHFVHPFDDPAIVAGQGTLGLELVEDVDDLAMVIVPLGGGGLVSGIACAIDALAPGVRVVAVQAELCAPFLAKRGGHPKATVNAGSSLADGIAVKRPSGITVGLIERHVDEIVAVGRTTSPTRS